jgi:hypothetical protein
MIVSAASKITLSAVVLALVLLACAAGSEALGLNRSDAVSSSSQQVTPAAGSSVQDMRDLYALKRQVAALRREPSSASGRGCNAGEP